MKNLLFFFATLFSGFLLHAQSTVNLVADMHSLLVSAETNFADQVGTVLMEDAETKTIYYHSKKPVEAAKTIIVKQPSGSAFTYSYEIIYDIRASGALNKVLPVLTAYTEELDAMEKSGKYTIEANESGSIKKLIDKKGRTVMNISWDLEFVNIYFFGQRS